MQPSDKTDFVKALNLCFATVLKPAPESDVLKLWVRLLQPYALMDVKEALLLHVTQSTYAPVPADVIGRINTRVDAWPGASEAWSIAKRAHNEDNTVILCAEIQQALELVRNLLDDGPRGDYNAAAAFKEAYLRISNVARKTLAVPRWVISQGHDAVQREQVVQQAVSEGRIGLSDGRMIYPALSGPGDHDILDDETVARNHSKVTSLLAFLHKKAEPEPVRDMDPIYTAALAGKTEIKRKVEALMMIQAREAAVAAREAAIARREAGRGAGA